MKSKFVHYYVEGSDEKKFIHTLKTDLNAIRPGKVDVLNVVTHKFTNDRLMTLSRGTMVVLIFDTDTGSADILNENLESLRSCPAVSEIVTIPQVHNLEDELVRSCDIKAAQDLLGSKSRSDFKTDLIRVTNLAQKLTAHKFDINLLWSQTPPSPYQAISNTSEKIKIASR